MAYVTPDGEIKLISGYPCDNTYNHTLFFTSTTQQYNTISAMARYTLTDRTYQRWDNKTLRVGMVADLLYDCNYMMFRNKHYSSDRWFYAFINRITYINDNCTEIEYEIDDMQSWLGEWTLLPSFVEREHAASDRPGENLEDEGLDIGEYMAATVAQYNFPVSVAADSDKTAILVAYTLAQDYETPHYKLKWDSTQQVYVEDQNLGSPTASANANIVSGVVIEPIVFTRGAQGISDTDSLDYAKLKLSRLIQAITRSLSGLSLVCMWEVPYPAFLAANNEYGVNTNDWRLYQPTFFPSGAGRPSYPASGESIRNNKLLTYPFCALSVSNNDGSSQDYHWELFETPSGSSYSAVFKVQSILQPSPIFTAYPYNYKNITDYYEAGVDLDNFVQPCWSEDSFGRWWTQNRSTYAMGFLSAAASATLGGFAMASGNVAIGASQLASAALSIGNSLARRQDAMATPDNLKGSLGGAGTKLAQNRQTFYAYAFTITAEKARIIDDFFTMYGYKTNRVKVPNVDVRERWCYTKTSGCKIHATTNADVEKHIENIFDHGITFWRDWEHVGDYTQSNGVRT